MGVIAKLGNFVTEIPITKAASTAVYVTALAPPIQLVAYDKPFVLVSVQVWDALNNSRVTPCNVLLVLSGTTSNATGNCAISTTTGMGSCSLQV